MFSVIERNDYLAVVLKETTDYLYIASPSLSKISKKVKQDGALAGLNQKQLAKLQGRGFARLSTTQDYDVVDEFNSLDEAVLLVRGQTQEVEDSNPLVKSRIAKFMTNENVDAMAHLDDELTNAQNILSVIATFTTAIKQKLNIVQNELNNRATAKDVKALKLSMDKIAKLINALHTNETTNTLLNTGASLLEQEDDFDANEFL